VFQRTAPSTSYPTPPPPGITNSSSSLAFALGNPVTKSTRTVHKSEDSTQYFHNFLEQKTRQMDPSRAVTPPPRTTQQDPLESPDPLALAPSSSTLFSASVVTPRKRKPEVYIASPTLKRVQSTSNFITPHKSLSPLTPQTSTTATATTTSKSSKKLQPYIEVPPLPKSWFTPSRSSSQKSITSLSKKMQGKMKVDDTHDDLGGYGSVDDDSPRRYWNSSVKSSARRTGDRDDRGISSVDNNARRLI
jgi:cohesin loading factor subunit SCC2